MSIEGGRSKPEPKNKVAKSSRSHGGVTTKGPMIKIEPPMKGNPVATKQPQKS